MELCEWLVMRGAKKLIITSRSGVTTGYQTWKIKRMSQMGAQVLVRKYDVCKMGQAEKLIKDATTMGPVGGVFHLAAVRAIY